jgi:hypothetical protein
MNLMKALRSILAVSLLVLFVQFTFAGMMIGGSGISNAKLLHGATGLLLVLLALIQLSLAIAMKAKGAGPAWLLTANIGILVVEVIEAVCGHFHVVTLHVPLALAIAGGVMRQLFWAFRETQSASEVRA